MLYYLEVVPTDIQTFYSHVKTYQYSVKETIRIINHDSGSHGIPGLYFKYDMSALKVKVLLDRESLVQLSIRLCSVIAGVIVISGFVNTFIQAVCDKFLKTFAPQVYHIKHDKQPLIQQNGAQFEKSKPVFQNNLILNANTGYDDSINVPINFTASDQ